MSDRPRLPLASLRVFEAAARHESFLRAADELAITPARSAARSRRWKPTSPCACSSGSNRAVRLTDTGQRLAIGVRQGIG